MNEQLKLRVNELSDSLFECRDAISYMGGVISGNEGFSHLPEAIKSIPSAEGVYSHVDNEFKATKNVPSGSLEYCFVESLGGMSHKDFEFTKNLIPYPYKSVSDATVDEKDGSIFFPFTDYTDVNIAFDEVTLYAGKTYILRVEHIFPDTVIEYNFGWETKDGNTIWNEYETLTPEQNMTVIGLSADFLNHGDLGGEIRFTLSITEGESEIPYQPRFKGLRDSKVTKIVSKGVNLFNARNITRSDISINEDGSKMLLPLMTVGNGQTNTYNKLSELCPTLKVGDVVYVRFTYDTASGNNMIYLGKSQFIWYNGAARRITEDDLNSDVSLYANRYQDGYTEQVTLLDFRIIRDKNLGFKPYVGTIGTTVIPEAIQNLDGYGQGLDAEYNNHIDFDRRVFVQKTCRKIFDGTEYFHNNVYLQSAFGRNAYQVSVSGLKGDKAPVCNLFECLKWSVNAGIAVNSVWYIDGGLIFITDGQQTVEEFKAYVKEHYDRGNPIIVEYALEAPIETQIDVPDPLIEVEGGGSLEFINEHTLPVPSTVQFEVLNV